MSNTYGDATKKIIFGSSGKIHADFKIKLQYDSFTQNEFFTNVIKSYLEDQEEFMKFIDSIKQKKKRKMNNRIRKVAIKEREEKKDIERLFSLTDDEVDSIFDLLEREANI